MRRRRPGDDDDAGGQLVEAADQRRPLRRRPRARVPEQRVHQRRRSRSCRSGARRSRRACRWRGGRRPRRARRGGRLPPPSPRAAARRAARRPRRRRARRGSETRRTGTPFTVTSPCSIHACTRVRVARRQSVQVTAQHEVEPESVVPAVGRQHSRRQASSRHRCGVRGGERGARYASACMCDRDKGTAGLLHRPRQHLSRLRLARKDCKCSSQRAPSDAIPTRIVAKLRMEKKGRGGKTVTVVDGLPQQRRVPEGAVRGAEARLRHRRRGRRDGGSSCRAICAIASATAHEERVRRQRLTYNGGMPKLTVEGYGTVDVADGKRLVLAIEQDAKVDILHACGGNARCTTCRVEFIDGEPAPHTAAERSGSTAQRPDRRPPVLPDPLRSRHDRPRDQPARGIRPAGSRRPAAADHHAARRVGLKDSVK